MLYGAKLAVCSEINTNHIYTKWAESRICNVKIGSTYSNI